MTRRNTHSGFRNTRYYNIISIELNHMTYVAYNTQNELCLIRLKKTTTYLRRHSLMALNIAYYIRLYKIIIHYEKAWFMNSK